MQRDPGRGRARGGRCGRRALGRGGFTTFKLKLGVGDDVAQVRAVREAVGPRARIRVDANARLGSRDRERMLDELEPIRDRVAEQPVGTMERAAELRATSIRRRRREHRDPGRCRAGMACGACALTGIKLSKVGGP